MLQSEKPIYFKTSESNHQRLDVLSFRTKTTKRDILNQILEKHLTEVTEQGIPLEHWRNWKK